LHVLIELFEQQCPNFSQKYKIIQYEWLLFSGDYHFKPISMSATVQDSVDARFRQASR